MAVSFAILVWLNRRKELANTRKELAGTLQQVLDLLEDENFDKNDAVIAIAAIRRHLGLDS
jgi:hypothetical protein